MKKKGKGILLLLLLCVFLTAQAFAAETVVEVKRIAPTSSESGYMLLTLDENQVDKLFTFPHTYFLPGDTAEGTFCFRLEAGLKPVALKLTAMNTGGAENQAIFNAVKLQIFNGTVNVYNGNLSELQNTEIAAFSNPEKTSADKKVYLKLSLDKTAAKEMQSQSLQFSLSVTALMTDYNVILPENHVSGTVKVYQSLYNHKYYYPVSGTPTLESQEVAKGQTEIYLPDFEYIPGTTIGDADDYYIDHTDSSLRVYVGADLTVGTPDDAKDLKDGTNVRRGTSATASEQFGGTGHAGGDHYYNGSDGIPGTEDDKIIYAGDDGAYGTCDDYYVDTDGLKVYSGYDFDNKKQDLIFGNANDAKALKKSSGEVNGTNVLRGASAAPAEQFGGTAHAGGTHYTNGPDKVPGTADDELIHAGDDPVSGVYYIDKTDNKKVYIGTDMCFGTADDAKDLEDGTNVCRGPEGAPAVQFGGAGYAGGGHFFNGADGTPGTADDKIIYTGTDGSFRTKDDYYIGDDGLEVYSGDDCIFGNSTDAKALEKSAGVKNGTCVLRGSNAAEFSGDHYYIGDDKIPGTADDRLISKGTDGVYGSKDDCYTDEQEGREVFSGKDLRFGTADDAMKIAENASNVRRGDSAVRAEQFGGAGHIAGAHYTNGADKIPGDATETVAAEDDDRLIYAGIDGIYNNSNDYYIADRRANVRAGKDLIWDTKDDEMWDIGSDAVHGNWNDIFLGYPNNTDAPENVGSYSGAAISGSFDTSVSPVGFGKSVNGVWSKDTFGRWSFTSEDGVKAKSKWVNIYSKALDKSDWYYFDNNGIMQSGWQKAGNSKWYFLRTVNDARFGAMEKGLIQDSSDGNYYYLDPVAGVMQTGWQKINGKYYYFAETSSGSAWFWNSQIGRWASAVLGGHPYGSMYRNEKTPDGRRVGADGARID